VSASPKTLLETTANGRVTNPRENVIMKIIMNLFIITGFGISITES
jgi:hypothetical protein